MKLNTRPTVVSIDFSPSDYWLKKSDNEYRGPYMLVVRIGMSYAGKDDQEGCPILYMNDQEAEVFRKAGFSEIL